MRGAGYQLDRHDLIASLAESTEGYVWNDLDQDTRKWFRPSDIAVGTDGSLFISDWYDPIVGGHQMHDSVGYGRIYRITPVGKSLVSPEIDLNTLEGQLTAIKNPAINVRIQGFEKLWGTGKEVIPEVEKVTTGPKSFRPGQGTVVTSQTG